MKFWNLSVKRGADGSKHLDVQIHGVIDGGWWDEDPVSTSEIISELQQHLDAKTIGLATQGIRERDAVQRPKGIPKVTIRIEDTRAGKHHL